MRYPRRSLPASHLHEQLNPRLVVIRPAFIVTLMAVVMGDISALRDDDVLAVVSYDRALVSCT